MNIRECVFSKIEELNVSFDPNYTDLEGVGDLEIGLVAPEGHIFRATGLPTLNHGLIVGTGDVAKDEHRFWSFVDLCLSEGLVARNDLSR